jgi:predicted dehydrogenase
VTVANKKYNLGMIGCGDIWNKGHWPQALAHLEDVIRVKYTYDADEERSRAAAEISGADAAPDVDKLFDDPEIDIVAIATPPFARLEFVKKACAAGKHVMLEKPMARSLDDAVAIHREVTESGVQCSIPFARTITGPLLELQALIGSGHFGAPKGFVHSNLGAPYGWIPLDHWMHDMEKSGGPIFDYSIHFVELARALMGAEAGSVFYAGKNTTGRVLSDDFATLLLEYENGAMGEFTKLWSFPPENPCSHQTTHVVLEDAVCEILLPSVKIYRHNRVIEINVKPNELPGRAKSYLNLIDAIENGAPLLASATDGLRIAETLDAALRSRESGKKELCSASL